MRWGVYVAPSPGKPGLKSADKDIETLYLYNLIH